MLLQDGSPAFSSFSPTLGLFAGPSKISSKLRIFSFAGLGTVSKVPKVLFALYMYYVCIPHVRHINKEQDAVFYYFKQYYSSESIL